MNSRIVGPATLRRAPRAAFSLIEIMLAVAIIAFALTGILGLFPVAVGAASESQHETQAAIIARSIFEQLQASPESSTRYFSLEAGDAAKQKEIAIDRPKTFSDVAALDSNGSPADAASAVYTVDITVAPLAPPNDKLSQVTVTVKHHKTSYPFTTLLWRQQ
jgi:prepilin-type N-terminal cleavage/methylation domain-containing protein